MSLTKRLLFLLTLLLATVLPASAGLITTSGSITSGSGAGNVVTLTGCDYYQSVSVNVSGTWSATLIEEVTADGTNWQTVKVYSVSADSAISSWTANGLYVAILYPINQVRVRASAYTSGTAVVIIRASDVSGSQGGSSMVSVSGTTAVAGTKSNNTAAPGATNVGTLPAIATAAAPSSTEGNQVGLSTDLSGNLRVGGTVTANAGTGTFGVAGGKTNNNAAPGATNVGTLGAIATAAAPSSTEGNQVGLSTDLAGALRVGGTVTANAGTGNFTITGSVAHGATDSGNPVKVGGKASSSLPTAVTAGQRTDAYYDVNGRQVVNLGNLISGEDTTNNLLKVAGPGAAGSALVGNPVVQGISDGTNARFMLGDTSGRATIVGAAATGAAVAGNPVYVGGKDGSGNAQPLATDTSGRPTVAGAAASGAAVAGNPVLVAGSDGTNARSVSTDTSGRVVTVGAAATGAAVAGNPVYVGGSDGTNAQPLKLDTSGRPLVSGAAANQAAVAGSPVWIGGSTTAAGGNVQSLMVETATNPNLRVSLYGGANQVATGQPIDGQSDGNVVLFAMGRNFDFNGSTWDKHRGNTDAIIQASTATTTQTINTDIVTYNAGKIIFHFNVTAYNGGTLTCKLQWKDANGLFEDIPGATTGAKTSGADLIVCLGANAWPTATTTEFYANFPVPRTVRLVETIATATITFSSAYSSNCN